MKTLVYSLSVAVVVLFGNITAIASPVSLWSAENNANDSIGSNHGTLVNGTTFGPGAIGQAFRFDGSNDYVEVSDSGSLDITSAITITAWINPSEISSRRIVDKITAGSGDGYLLDIFGGNLRMIVDSRIFQAPAVLSTGSFQHVAGVYDGQIIRLYVNGIESGSFDFGSVAAIPTNNLNLRIGADSTGANVFLGNIDEARIFDNALSASEIRTLATIPLPSSLALLGSGILLLVGRKFKSRKAQNNGQSAVRLA